MPTKTIGHLLLVKNVYLGGNQITARTILQLHFRDEEIVGHVPFSLSNTVSQF